MTPAIRTEGLTKFYRKILGIEDLDLEVRSGEVFGFLGPNGAGKTTTIRLLLDLLRPTRGAAQVLGMDVRTHSVEIRRRVGYLPGELGLYERLTAWELLTYFAHLRGLDDLGHARELAGRLDLDTSRPVRTLSHGNRQKVGLVQAFMHRPRLLVLDEPTGGLDPLIQHEFYGLLREVRGRRCHRVPLLSCAGRSGAGRREGGDHPKRPPGGAGRRRGVEGARSAPRGIAFRSNGPGLGVPRHARGAGHRRSSVGV
jgi:ABC-type multidrug transport system ATPase subunit